MKNMFKKSLVAVAIASTSMAASAAEISVTGGSFSQPNMASNPGTVSNEWLQVNSVLEVGFGADNSVTSPDLAGLKFGITLGEQYSEDDRIFVTFSGESLDVSSLPVSDVGTKGTDIITIGRIGSEVVNGNTVVEYRVTNVSEGANTDGAVITFGDESALEFDASEVRANNGIMISYEAYYKNGGARFDQGKADTNVALVMTGNELDGFYPGNLTARIDTFTGVGTNGQQGMSRYQFVADSGQGRGNEVTYAGDDVSQPATGVVATNAATVTPTTVSNDFVFQGSAIRNAYNWVMPWDVQLAEDDINTNVEVQSDFSWFLYTHPTTGDTLAYPGNDVASGTTWAVSGVAAPTSCVDSAVQQAAHTPSSLFFTCTSGTDFSFELGASAAWSALPRTDFNFDITMKYSGDAGTATKDLSLHAGTWTNDGTSVFIPYMPYGKDAGVSQLLFVSNTGPISRQIAVDVYPRSDSFRDVVPLNVTINAAPGITKITGQVEDALEEAGLLTGGVDVFSLELIIAGSNEEIEVYSGYNVNQDRNFVTNSSNRRDTEVRTDYTDGSVDNN